MPFARRLVAIALLCLALLGGPAAAQSSPEPARRTLLVNADGLSFAPDGTMRRFSMLLVGGDGRVLALLPAGAAEPRLAPGDYRLDVAGRAVIPGLIDAHGHLMGLGHRLRQLDLSDAASLAAAQELIRTRVEAGTGWVTGGGWNQERWATPGAPARFPTAADLDAATGTRPAALERIDGHALWVNSAALKAAGITRLTKDPPGGKILRDAAGNPTGILVDAAAELVLKVAPRPSGIEAEKALEAALAHMAEVGLTGLHDMGTTAADWQLFRAFGDEGRLSARITAYAAGMEAMEAIAPVRPTPSLYGDRLRLVGIKLYTDGALGSRGAHLHQPYADAPATRGLRFHDDTRLKNLISRANFVGYQVAAHAIGDAANSQLLDAFAETQGTYRQLRNRVEHAQVVRPADIPRFASLGLIASMQPTHATSDREMAEARLGPARLDGAYAWKTFLDAGVALALGSDTPVEPANPFFGLHAAVTRQGRDGRPPGGWRMGDALDLPTALKGFTIDAAHAGFMEGKVGTLEPGAWADFLVLPANPMTVPPATLWQLKPDETWLAGRRVFQRGSRPRP